MNPTASVLLPCLLSAALQNPFYEYSDPPGLVDYHGGVVPLDLVGMPAFGKARSVELTGNGSLDIVAQLDDGRLISALDVGSLSVWTYLEGMNWVDFAPFAHGAVDRGAVWTAGPDGLKIQRHFKATPGSAPFELEDIFAGEPAASYTHVASDSVLDGATGWAVVAAYDAFSGLVRLDLAMEDYDGGDGVGIPATTLYPLGTVAMAPSANGLAVLRTQTSTFPGPVIAHSSGISAYSHTGQHLNTHTILDRETVAILPLEDHANPGHFVWVNKRLDGTCDVHTFNGGLLISSLYLGQYQVREATVADQDLDGTQDLVLTLANGSILLIQRTCGLGFGSACPQIQIPLFNDRAEGCALVAEFDNVAEHDSADLVTFYPDDQEVQMRPGGTFPLPSNALPVTTVERVFSVSGGDETLELDIDIASVLTTNSAAMINVWDWDFGPGGDGMLGPSKLGSQFVPGLDQTTTTLSFSVPIDHVYGTPEVLGVNVKIYEDDGSNAVLLYDLNYGVTEDYCLYGDCTDGYCLINYVVPGGQQTPPTNTTCGGAFGGGTFVGGIVRIPRLPAVRRNDVLEAEEINEQQWPN